MPAIDHHLVRDKRDELDLSNRDLASKLGTKPSYVVNLMCGSRSPSRRLIYRLSRALDIPVEEILLGERTPQGDPSEPPVQPAKDPKGPARRKDTEDRRTGPKRARNAEAVAS